MGYGKIYGKMSCRQAGIRRKASAAELSELGLPSKVTRPAVSGGFGRRKRQIARDGTAQSGLPQDRLAHPGPSRFSATRPTFPDSPSDRTRQKKRVSLPPTAYSTWQLSTDPAAVVFAVIAPATSDRPRGFASRSILFFRAVPGALRESPGGAGGLANRPAALSAPPPSTP